MIEDIRIILDELGYHKVTETPKEFRMRPLYRESQNETSLVIYKDTGQWYDFVLRAGGNLLDFTKLHSIDDAANWLNQHNISVSDFNRKNQHTQIKLPRIFEKDSLLRLVKDDSYWYSRGIEGKLLRDFQGGVSVKGKMANRYVFPIFNRQMKIIGACGRDLLPKSEYRPKWKILGPSSCFVYPAFLNHENIRKERSVFLVESIGDCLSLYNAGVTNSLVLFGVNLGYGVINYLLKLDLDRIYISLNNEAVGNQYSQEITVKLSQYFDCHQIEVRLPTKKDFGEMKKGEIDEWKRNLNFYQQVA